MKDEDDLVSSLRSLLLRLPSANYTTLYWMVHHLALGKQAALARAIVGTSGTGGGGGGGGGGPTH